MKTKFRELSIVLLILTLISLCFASWDNTKPADNDAWNDAAGYIRDNWDALEAALGVDLADVSTGGVSHVYNVKNPAYGALGDGSNDDTYNISVKNGAKVIKLKDVGYYAVGRPHLAKVINIGIKDALNYCPDYIMISGSDDTFSANYIEELIKIMIENNSIIITSGYIVGEAYDYNSPRGSGRIIKTSTIKRIIPSKIV